MMLHIGLGGLSAAVASNIYRSQDRPRFILGLFCSWRFNERREQEKGGIKYGVKQLRMMGNGCRISGICSSPCIDVTPRDSKCQDTTNQV
ncbi:hypothetical protein BDZ89DRAFT_1060776 [Hymenopellis radicata]|nr:hypothetical protein BDZ89DRAFT_1060776 [Hymenopellis radicata]